MVQKNTRAAGPTGTRLTRGMLSFFQFGSSLFTAVIAFLFVMTFLAFLLGCRAEVADSAKGGTNLSRHSVVYTKDVSPGQLRKGDLFLGDGEYSGYLYIVRDIDTKTGQLTIASANDPDGKTIKAVLSEPVSKAAVIVKGAGLFLGAVDGNPADRIATTYFLILGFVLIAGMPITRALMRMQDEGV